MTDSDYIATQTAKTLSNKGELNRVFDSLLKTDQKSMRLDVETVVRLFKASVKGAIEPGYTIDEEQNELLVKGLKVVAIISKIKPVALVSECDDSSLLYAWLFRYLVPLLEEDDLADACCAAISGIMVAMTESPQSWGKVRQAQQDLLSHVRSGVDSLKTSSNPALLICRALRTCWSIMSSITGSDAARCLCDDSDAQLIRNLVEKIWLNLQKQQEFESIEYLHLLFMEVISLGVQLPGERSHWGRMGLQWVNEYLRQTNDIRFTGPLLHIAVFLRKGLAVNIPALELSKVPTQNFPLDITLALNCIDSALNFKGVDFSHKFSRPEWTAMRDSLKSEQSQVGMSNRDPQKLLVYCKGSFRSASVKEKRQTICQIGRFICWTAGTMTVSGECNFCDRLEPMTASSFKKHIDVERQPKSVFVSIFDAIIESLDRIDLKRELLHAIKRYAAMYEPMRLESTVGIWIVDCLRCPNRSLRIAATKLLPYFIQCKTKGNTAKLLKMLGEISASPDKSLVETTIMAWGQIARICNGETLNVVLLRLLEGLLPENTIINSLTFHELGEIASFRDTTVYQLCAPFWSTIAIDMVKRLNTHRGYITRFAELLGVSVDEFLRRTPAYTVPYLILAKEYSIVEQIAQLDADRQNVSLRDFYLAHMDQILAVLLVKVLGNWNSDESPLNMVQLLIYDSGLFPDVDFGMMVSPFINRAVFEVLKHYDWNNYDLIVGALKCLSSMKYSSGTVEELLNDNVVPQVVISASSGIKNLDGSRPYTFKLQCLSALSMLMMCAPQSVTAKAVPQICANLQNCLEFETLQQAALRTWLSVVQNLQDQTLRGVVNLTFSVIVQRWSEFGPQSKSDAKAILEYIIRTRSELIKQMIPESGVPSLVSVSELANLDKIISQWVVQDMSPLYHLRHLLQRCQDENVHVVRQTVIELRDLIRTRKIVELALQREKTVAEMCKLMRTLLTVSSRFPPPDTDISEICAECFGLIGALDHHRVNITPEKHEFVLVDNFESAQESKELVIMLLEDYLIKTYRALTDPHAQLFLAWGIQELLKFCDLNVASVQSSTLWKRFSAGSRSILTPLLSSKYSTPKSVNLEGCSYPIYKQGVTTSHTKWVKTFTFDLMSKAKGRNAEQVFHLCLRATRNLSQAGLLNFLLPYAALNVVLSGFERENVLKEVLAVLESPVVDSQGVSRAAFHQTIFVLVDYLAKWMRKRRTMLAASHKHNRAKSAEGRAASDQAITTVETFLSRISPDLLAEKSFECKSYPRAIMYWEQYLRDRRKDLSQKETDEIYEKFQEIYSNIDDPDSLDGIAAKFPEFNTNQQIIRYESTGRWEYALECYEASIKELNTWDEEIPKRQNDVQTKILNCLKQAGRYEDLLSRLSEQSKIGEISEEWIRMGIEVSWLSANWPSLNHWLNQSKQDNYEVNIGTALMALKNGNDDEFESQIKSARKSLAAEVSSANITSLAQCHDPMTKLHGLADLQDIHTQATSDTLDSRLAVVGADFSARRYLLALRRSALSLCSRGNEDDEEIRQRVASAWIKSAKDGRNQGQSALALQASIRAQMSGSDLGKVENARVLWDHGDQRKAPEMLKSVLDAKVIETLENYRQVRDIPILTREQAKIAMLYTTWLDVANEEGSEALVLRYKALTKMQPQWEKAHYKLAKYYNKLFDSQAELPESMQNTSFIDGEYVGQMVLNYLRSLQFGVKYIYETLPKLVTVWLDFAANLNQVGTRVKKASEIIAARQIQLRNINKQIRSHSQKVPAYIFYLVLPQLLSRMLHDNDEVASVIRGLIAEITKQYPHQALWFIFGSAHSTERQRQMAGRTIIDRLKVTKSSSYNLRHLIDDAEIMTSALIDLTKQNVEKRVHTMQLSELGFMHVAFPSNLVVPVQNMMNTTLPNHPNAVKNHTAFPSRVQIQRIEETVSIQSSMQKPKRITIIGTDGKEYRLLCKRNDDVRKDAKLMEFARSIDKLLATDEEASQRHLRINTYHVTPMTELTGLIEWVDGAEPLRIQIIQKLFDRGIQINWSEAKTYYDKTRPNENERLSYYRTLLERYPSVLYEWFIENFPDPSSWLEARTHFARTAAVMSIVGYIVGLGDRHSENLLLIKKTGAVMHVDFDMLFDKGLSLADPERVPFRLTQQIEGAMGISGYEGIFRKSCEVALRVMRTNEGMLMTVLEPFLHEPFVDWTDKRAMRGSHTVINGLRPSRSPEEALASIRRKIRGIKGTETIPLSVSGHVEYLIKLATSQRNLSQMYVGWAAFM